MKKAKQRAYMTQVYSDDPNQHGPLCKWDDEEEIEADTADDAARFVLDLALHGVPDGTWLWAKAWDGDIESETYAGYAGGWHEITIHVAPKLK